MEVYTLFMRTRDWKCCGTCFESMDQAHAMMSAYDQWDGREVGSPFMEALCSCWEKDQSDVNDTRRPVLEWLQERMLCTGLRTPLFFFHQWPRHKDAVLAIAALSESFAELSEMSIYRHQLRT